MLCYTFTKCGITNDLFKLSGGSNMEIVAAFGMYVASKAYWEKSTSSQKRKGNNTKKDKQIKLEFYVFKKNVKILMCHYKLDQHVSSNAFG